MKTNYHTHHELCGHAMGECEDYTLEALKHGFTELGFSDHAPNEGVYDARVRMQVTEIDQYLDDIQYVKEKYKDKIKIYSGFEVEFFYNHEQYLKELSEKVDYLVLGQHYVSFQKNLENLISGFGLHTKEQILLYRDYVCDGMKTGYFKIIAHPDLYMHSYIEFDDTAEQVARDIIKTAKETNTILEFNANGFRKGKRQSKNGMIYTYPNTEFFKIVKEYDCEVLISSDCHVPEQLNDDAITKAEEVVNKLGLKIRQKIFE
jgi:histidinol-phosphatase (PHP family)